MSQKKFDEIVQKYYLYNAQRRRTSLFEILRSLSITDFEELKQAYQEVENKTSGYSRRERQAIIAVYRMCTK